MTAHPAEVPVTYCPPFKRSREVRPRAKPDVGGPTLSTATALQWPEKPRLVPPARNDRRSAQERVEAAEREETMSVALSQPHRQGSDDPRLAFPLGRFCAKAWRNDPHFADKMHAAGASYAADVRALQVAKGFHVSGGQETDGLRFGAINEDPTPEEIEAARANIFALERTLARADDLLRDVIARLPGAMRRLCYDHADVSPYDEDMLRTGLYRLAVHYGHFEIGINRT